MSISSRYVLRYHKGLVKDLAASSHFKWRRFPIIDRVGIMLVNVVML